MGLTDRSPTPAGLAHRVAVLEAELEAVKQQLVALQPSTALGPAEEALIDVLGVQTGAELFSARDVFDAQRLYPKLHEALEAAWIDSPRQLGKLLKKCAVRTVTGWRVLRGDGCRAGAQWRILRVSHSQTRAEAG